LRLRAELHFLAMRKLPVRKSVFPDVDFASVAEAFGFQAYTIRTPDELRALGSRPEQAGRAHSSRLQRSTRRSPRPSWESSPSSRRGTSNEV
jgi:thiamine pyrophosphate-dependent acetolactate synthase large subunit-like protein